VTLRSLFKRPPADYSPLAFWFWNENLKERELIRQARDLFAHGVRGFFMHARSGLLRPSYLSPGWMHLIESVVRESKTLGAKAWLYDEMGWPSGTAGGRVPRLDRDYQEKFVECIPLPVSGRRMRVAAGRDVVAVFHSDAYPLTRAGQPRDITTLLGPGTTLDAKKLPRGWILAFAVGLQPTYADTLRREPVAAFIRLTHEAYKKRIGKHFGATVPGIFTDEPSHRAYDLRKHVLTAPWTGALPAAFQARCGYSLLPNLPSLFFDVGDFERVRRDFWETVSELFSSNYGGTIYDWCDQNGIAFTGHYEYEVPLHMQIQCLSAAMPLYRLMQIPGLDLLGRNRPRYERPESIVLAKQPASIANQAGRNRILCEAFGTGGWDFGPERQKWQADWLFALGANMLCLHGFYYSIAGVRKFDAPPDFLRLPWFKISKPLHDHYARLSFVLSRGKPVRRVLVIHPLRAAWAKHRPQDHVGICDREDSRIGKAFGALLDALVESHLDFDLADEGFLRQAQISNRLLVLGQAQYRVAIIPPMMHLLEPSTISLLNAMADQGATVISLSNPRSSDGTGSALGAQVRFSTSGAAAQRIRQAVSIAAKALTDRTMVNGPGADAIAMHERDLPAGKRVIFLSNSSLDDVRAAVRVPGCWRVEKWDTATGDAHHLNSEGSRTDTKIALHFAPAESHLLVLTPTKRPQRPGPPPRRRTLLTLAAWQVEAAAPNLLTFDYCRARSGRAWSQPLPMFKVRSRRNRGALRFEFINRIPSGAQRELLFAFEGGKAVTVLANGRRLKPTKAALPDYLDFCSAVDIAPCLVPGKNAVDVLPLSGDPPAEKAYLLGDFGLRRVATGIFAIEPPQPGIGPWHECGFPFFSGPMRYSCEFPLDNIPGGRVFLEVASLREAAEVFVNSRKVGDLLWRPWRIEMTRLLRPGTNKIEVMVYGSLRNAFGPWHFPGDQACAGFSYHHWTDRNGWTNGHLFVPLGLLANARLTLMAAGA
jgi:hypothetical protein